MYPYLKLATTLLKAKFRSGLSLDDVTTQQLWVGPTDVDPFMELNHARHLFYMELARWDFGYRTGLLSLCKRHRWGIAAGGASVRYRRRVPLLSRFTLETRLVCHDGRWFYFLQEILRGEQICSSALLKIGVTSRDGLVPAPQVLKQMGFEDWRTEMPDWVSAWIEAEGMRPWPNN